MSNRFYYNGELVRTSKNHIYTHAVVNDEGQVCGCCGSLELAKKLLKSYITGNQTYLAKCKSAIEALKRNEKGFFYKECNRRFYRKFNANDTVEYYEKICTDVTENILVIEKDFQIVELEIR